MQLTIPRHSSISIPLFSDFRVRRKKELASGTLHVVKFKMAAGSQLFRPFRALGFVANHVPLTTQTQGTESLVTTAVGSAFHVYNVREFYIFEIFDMSQHASMAPARVFALATKFLQHFLAVI